MIFIQIIFLRVPVGAFGKQGTANAVAHGLCAVGECCGVTATAVMTPDNSSVITPLKQLSEK